MHVNGEWEASPARVTHGVLPYHSTCNIELPSTSWSSWLQLSPSNYPSPGTNMKQNNHTSLHSLTTAVPWAGCTTPPSILFKTHNMTRQLDILQLSYWMLRHHYIRNTSQECTMTLLTLYHVIFTSVTHKFLTSSLLHRDQQQQLPKISAYIHHQQQVFLGLCQFCNH